MDRLPEKFQERNGTGSQVIEWKQNMKWDESQDHSRNEKEQEGLVPAVPGAPSRVANEEQKYFEVRIHKVMTSVTSVTSVI